MTTDAYQNCVERYKEAFIFEKRDLTISDMQFASLYEKRGETPIETARYFGLEARSEMFS